MRNVRFHPAAAEEAEAAADWYNSEKLGLGEDFAKELIGVIALLRQLPIPSVPHPYTSRRAKIQRLLMRRFPYDVVFIVRDEAALIIAVAHQSRRPGYWKSRLRT